MDHCEPNRPYHLPDWKIWMIEGRFEVQQKSGNTWITLLLNTQSQHDIKAEFSILREDLSSENWVWVICGI